MRKAVVKRKDDKHLVTLINTYDRVRLLYICSIVSMSKEDSLRVCCRTRCITDVSIIIRPYRLISLDELLLVLCKELVSHLHDLANVDLIFLLVIHLVKDDDLLNHRTLREYLSYLRKLELGCDHIF